jgi:hypothetical protein
MCWLFLLRLIVPGTNIKLHVHLFSRSFKAVYSPSLCLNAHRRHRGSDVVRRVCIVAKSDCLLRRVCPHGTTRLPLDGFSLNLVFEYF